MHRQRYKINLFSVGSEKHLSIFRGSSLQQGADLGGGGFVGSVEPPFVVLIFLSTVHRGYYVRGHAYNWARDKSALSACNLPVHGQGV